MKTRLTSIAFLIIIVSCINPANAIIYTFDHGACATEDSTVCLCDTYNAATDTCTISETHAFSGATQYDPIYLYMNFDNLHILSSGEITSVAASSPIAIWINTIGTSISGSLPMLARLKIDTFMLGINSGSSIGSSSVSITSGGETTISGTISSHYIDITSTDSLEITDTGIIDINFIGNSDTSISLTAPDMYIDGTINAENTAGASDITIQSTDLDISGAIISSSSGDNAGTVTIHSTNTGISGSIDVRGLSDFANDDYIENDALIIESGSVGISGPVGGISSPYSIKIIINADDLYISGGILNTGENKYNGLADVNGITSISADNIALTGAGKIETGNINPAPIYITYCTLTPAECETPGECSQIIADAGDIFLNNNCPVGYATCKAGDGCMAKDHFTDLPCLPPDPDCPICVTGIPVPTLLSLQGTVTDADDNLIDGTITVTSLEKCQDTTCTTKTAEDISGAANDISFTGSIVNSMLGPYNIIPDLTYMLTVKVCNLAGLCDENIQIIFTD